MGSKKVIFEYDNFREFLKDYYLKAKERNKNFSYRYFSRIAGFKSPNFLKMVMDGQRNLAPNSIDKFASALKLNKEETSFFRSLVLLNQASTADERQRYAEEIIHSRAYRRTQPLKESQYRFFAHWYYVLIRELVGLPFFKEDYDWIGKQVRPHLSAAEAKRAVEELLKLSVLERDASGRLKQMNSNVGTPDEVTSSSIAHCHRQLMKLASASIDDVAREKRDISAITFIASGPTVKKIKEKIQKFRKELLELASVDNNPDNVYQLNFQFFPLTESDEGKKI